MSKKKIVWVKEYRESELLPIEGIQGRWKRYVDPKETGWRLISGLGRLEPGEDMGWHNHPEEEVFVVISGIGLVRWEEDGQIMEAEVGPGYAFYKEGNVPHQMVNTGIEPLVGIASKVTGDE